MKVGGFVTIGELTHEETQEIVKNWERTNIVIGLLTAKGFPWSTGYALLSQVNSWNLEDADNGNGVIVQRLQYPNGCDYCGGAGKFQFLPR